MPARTSLSSGWTWRLANSNGNKVAESKSVLKKWADVSAFPSVIQMELLEQKHIPDFNIGENERLVQWVGEVDWEYQCSFQTPKDYTGHENVGLIFEGLDTFATVHLNGTRILESDNMFVPSRVEVKRLLKPEGGSNILTILFESALKRGTELEEKYGKKKSIMRDTRRMHMRKAQYHWGWDWGPCIVTAGPYLPIHLEAYSTRIENVHISSALSDDHSEAVVKLEINHQATPTLPPVTARVSIYGANGALAASSSISIERDRNSSISVTITQPKLWWPNGEGDQHLYAATVQLLDGSSAVLNESTAKFGVRTIEVIQRPLKEAEGTTFMFRVNGRDIFAQGGDWIPADMLIPTISRERYFEWANIAKYCHLNMIRVWGGGIYETEDFFDACDETGMLVWYDYALACGDYPVHSEFVDSVVKEAEAQTIRMRNRASLALLCGGNEDFMLMDEWQKVDYDHFDETGPFDDKPFPQRKIYLQALPAVAARLAPNIQYWANSPYGGKLANDPTVGDIHQWRVWHGDQLPYQEYSKLSGRFVSEFGMHGFPVQRTVDYFTSTASTPERHPQSRLIDCHNKGHGAHTRIARYLAENFRFDMTELESFVYSSQLMQSEAYGYALRQWKRKFSGPGYEECAGAIIWQLNDVYPGTSWAFVDYFIRPKPAYYTIKRSFAPISIGVDRTPSSRWVDEDAPNDSQIPSFTIWAHNTQSVEAPCRLVFKSYDFSTGKYTKAANPANAERDILLKAGQNNEVGRLDPDPSWTEESLIILELTIVEKETGKQLARLVDWPEPFRYLYWPKDTWISLSIEAGRDINGKSWDNIVSVSSNQPLKGVWIEPIYDGSEKDDDREPLWEDNMIDLMPGRTIRIGVDGLRGRKVSARFYADWEL